MRIHQGGLAYLSRGVDSRFIPYPSVWDKICFLFSPHSNLSQNGRPAGHGCLKLIQSWILHSMIDVQFLIHRSSIVIPEGSQRLTASPQAFTVPGQLTVTIEWSLDLVLIIGFMLHSINPYAKYKRTYRKKALLIQYPSKKCPILFIFSATIPHPTMKEGGAIPA